MTLEQLMAKGLTKEHAELVMSLHKEAIDGNYIPRATFDSERALVKGLKDQVSERDKQIEGLGKFKGTAEELTKKVADLEKANKESADKHAAEMSALVLATEIRGQISSVVYDTDDVMSKLDTTKIVIKEGKIVSGLTEQIDALKKSKPHYFKKEGGGEAAGLPGGWVPFGRTPPAGGEPDNNNDDGSKFGMELAKSKSVGETASKKAADIYFK